MKSQLQTKIGKKIEMPKSAWAQLLFFEYKKSKTFTSLKFTVLTFKNIEKTFIVIDNDEVKVRNNHIQYKLEPFAFLSLQITNAKWRSKK